MRTGGGNLTAAGLGGPLTFTTDGGDVNGDGLTAPTLSTDSGGGDDSVTVPQSASSGDQITVNSGGGRITVSEEDS